MRYKKILIIILCLCLIIPTVAFGTPEYAKAATKGICTATSSLNVRTGPGTTYDQVMIDSVAVTLKPDQEVTILAKEGDWYKISGTFNGKSFEGYAISTYIKDTKEAIAEPVTTTYKMNVKGVITASELNLRSGAGTTYDKVATLTKDTQVTVVGDEFNGTDRWYQIKVTVDKKSVTGYVLAKYVEFKISSGFYGSVNVSSVKLSQKAGASEEAVTYASGKAVALSKGRLVWVLAEQTVNQIKYLQVKVTISGVSYKGYLAADQITLLGSKVTSSTETTPTATPTPTPTPVVEAVHQINLSAKITSNTLNIRSGAATSSKKVAQLTKSDTMTILTEKFNGTQKWYQIRAKVNNKTVTGFVLSDYVKITMGTGFYAKVSADSVTYKETASESAGNVVTNENVTVTRKKGTYVWVSEEKTVDGTKWFRISYQKNSVVYYGYVKANDLALIGKKKDTVATPTPTPSIPAETTPTPTTAPVEEVKECKIPATVNASSLNMRKEPSTSSSKVTSLTQSTKVTILGQTGSGSDVWYQVTATVNGKEVKGYVYAQYIKLTLSKAVTAMVAGDNLSLNSSASSSAGHVKKADGSIATLAKNQKVTVKKEQMVNTEKWFQIQATIDGEKVTGYVLASALTLYANGEVADATPTPVPTATPTVAPTSTPTPTATPIPTATPTITPTPTPQAKYYTASAVIINTAGMGVKTSPQFGSDFVKNTNGYPVILVSDYPVTVNGEYYADDTTWFGITFNYGDASYNGFVSQGYIKVDENTIVDGGSGSIIIPPSPTVTPTPTPIVGATIDFEASLAEQGFPESYKAQLRILHEKYPNWKFTAFHTGLDWNTVIQNEAVVEKNLIPNSKGIEWKSLETGAYNWKTDSFVVYDGSTWVTASKEAVEYYMDPRNFLNENGIFQFELLSYQSDYQNLEGVENILMNTPMYQTSFTYTASDGTQKSITYGETFLAAAEYSGVSPYHLASRVKQEVVTGRTSFSNSVTGTVSGLEGLYNFYNIGAYHSTVAGGAIANGLKYAKNGSTNASLNVSSLIPWSDRYRAIVGGSYIIGSTYINRGQNSIYLQKFNVTSTSRYSHQYMANVEAPYSEAKKVFAGYTNVSNLPIVFSIPVYLNMPETACSIPAAKSNPNNYLKTLTVTDQDNNDLALTPTFDILNTTDFAIVVPFSNVIMNVNATCVSSKATVSGTGAYPLNVGLNEITVTVVAQNGDVRNYKINVIRESE